MEKSAFEKEIENRKLQDEVLGTERSHISNRNEIATERATQTTSDYKGNLTAKFEGTQAGADHITDLGNGAFGILWRDTTHDQNVEVHSPSGKVTVRKKAGDVIGPRDTNPNVTIYKVRPGIDPQWATDFVNITKSRGLNTSIGKNIIWKLRGGERNFVQPDSPEMQVLKKKDPALFEKFSQANIFDTMFEATTWEGYSKKHAQNPKTANYNAEPMAALRVMMDEINTINKNGYTETPKTDRTHKLADLTPVWQAYADITNIMKEKGVNRSVAASNYWATKKADYEKQKGEWTAKQAPTKEEISKAREGVRAHKEIFKGQETAPIGEYANTPDVLEETKRILGIMGKGGVMPTVLQSGITYEHNDALLKDVPERIVKTKGDRKTGSDTQTGYKFWEDPDRIARVTDAKRAAIKNLNDLSMSRMVSDMNYNWEKYLPALRNIGHAAGEVQRKYGINYDEVFLTGLKSLAKVNRTFVPNSDDPNVNAHKLQATLGHYLNPMDQARGPQDPYSKHANKKDLEAKKYDWNILSSDINTALLSGQTKTNVSKELEHPSIQLYKTISPTMQEEREKENTLYGKDVYHKTLINPEDVIGKYKAQVIGERKVKDIRESDSRIIDQYISPELRRIYGSIGEQMINKGGKK